MIDIYFTDTIKVFTVTFDDWGKETRTESTLNCRIEDENRIVKDREGNEVAGNAVIFLSYNANITYHDKINILTKNGSTFDQPDKEFLPLVISRYNNFMEQHVEVVI